MTRQHHGFSLIELMVTIAVFTLLVAIAAPWMGQYMANSKVLASAQSFYVSAQQARTEAIRRNVPVELLLTAADPTSGNAGSATAAAAGPNWMVRTAPDGASPTHDFIEGKSGAEGGGKADAGTAKSSVVITASSGSIRFDALGALTTAGPVTVDFSHDTLACEPDGGVRCVRVVVAGGGQTRLCDPLVTGAGDTRRC
ncbi:MAG: prepilin-type N-terminal cleavage/methylation domain-containing protein [Comamonadaceae bacterium]|nr:MAG: prepilin-type N-terminal cleavage/methylation domain-containing protein [Comamonadaceae bacterium]